MVRPVGTRRDDVRDLFSADRAKRRDCGRQNPSGIAVRHHQQRKNPSPEPARLLAAFFRGRRIARGGLSKNLLESPINRKRMRKHIRFYDFSGERARPLPIPHFDQMPGTREHDRIPSVSREKSRDLLACERADVAAGRKMQRNEENAIHLRTRTMSSAPRLRVMSERKKAIAPRGLSYHPHPWRIRFSHAKPWAASVRSQRRRRYVR